MNNLLFYKKILLVALVALALPSCSDDDDDSGIICGDIMPVEISIEISDADGNDLLDPKYENNIIGEDITMIYDGETYDVMWNTPDPLHPEGHTESRYHPVTYFCMSHHLFRSFDEPSETNKWVLQIGEFTGYENHDIVIPLKIKGKAYDIHFVHEFEWGSTFKNTLYKTSAYLNGKKYEYAYVKIII